MYPFKFETADNYLITTGATVMVVSLGLVPRALSLGREWRMRSSLPSTCQAAHYCSGLYPPLQPRGKGMIFSNSPILPQAVYSKTAGRGIRITLQASSSSDEKHVDSKSFHFSKKGKKVYAPLSCHPRLTKTRQHLFFSSKRHQKYMLTHSLAQKPVFGTETKDSQLKASGFILSTASIISR